MANYKNSEYAVLTTKDTFPRSATKTGTMSVTAKQIVGNGTLFLTELHVGDWIFVTAQTEIRRVMEITDNTHATIDRAFTANIGAGAAVIVTPASQYCEIGVVIPPALGNGQIDGVAFYAGVPMTFSKASRDQSAQNDFVDPIIVDGIGTAIMVIGIK